MSTVRALFAVFIAVCAKEAHCNLRLFFFFPFCNAQSFAGDEITVIFVERSHRARMKNVAWNHGTMLDK